MFGKLAKIIEENFVDLKDRQGLAVIQIGLFVTLYFEKAYLPKKALAVAQCFNDYLEMCGKHLRWASNKDVKRWGDLKQKEILTPKYWIQSHRLTENDLWFFEYNGGNKPEEASHYYIASMNSRKWQCEMGEL
jgi:hypothetical protein